LDQKYLPQVIHIIHKYAPNLLDTDASQAGGVEEIEISVDNLQPGVLRELDTLIKSIRSPTAGIAPSAPAPVPVPAAAPVAAAPPQFQTPAQPVAAVVHTQTTTSQLPPAQEQNNGPTVAAAAAASYYPPPPQQDIGAGTPMEVTQPAESTQQNIQAGGDATDAFMSIQ